MESRFGDLCSSLEEVKSDFKDPSAFIQSVLSSSLTSTIFSQFPEIGQFLHLPEIDPGLVRGFDQSIASDVLNDYIREVIKSVKKSDIDKILTDPKLNDFSDEIQKIKFRWLRLNNYIRGLLGIEISENPDLAGENHLYELFVRMDQESRKRIVWGSSYAIGGLCAIGAIIAVPNLPMAIALLTVVGGFNTLVGGASIVSLMSAKQRVRGEVKQLVEEYSQKLDQMYETIQELNDLKKLIEKREGNRYEISYCSHFLSIARGFKCNSQRQDRCSENRP